MDRLAKKFKYLIVLSLMMFVVGAFVYPDNTFAQTDTRIRAKEKAEKAEKIKAKKDAEKKAKREAAEKKRQQKADRARQKKLDQAQAKAKKQRLAMQRDLYQKEKVKAAAEIAKAKKTRDSKLAAFKTKKVKQQKQLQSQVASKKGNLKKKFNADRSAIIAQRNKSVADLKKQPDYDKAYKQKVSQLKAQYKKDLVASDNKANALKQKADSESATIKKDIAKLDTRVKNLAKQTKAQKADAKKVNNKKESDAKAKYTLAVKDAKKQKADKKRLDQLKADYQAQLKQIDLDYQSQIAAVNEDHNTKASQIAEEKASLIAKDIQIKADAKKQLTQIVEDKELLKSQYQRNVYLAHPVNKLKSEYDDRIADVEADYNDKVTKLDQQLADQQRELDHEQYLIESDYDNIVARTNLRLRLIKETPDIEDIKLPVDESPVLNVKEIVVRGNILMPTSELFEAMPLIFNASDEPIQTADSQFLYDLRPVQDIIINPGKEKPLSTRTIQGLTQYILSRYQDENYAGIYVYVPKDALVSATEVKQGILPIQVLEAPVNQVSITTYDSDQNKTEEGYLNKSAVMNWSPLETGEVANQKKLDDFVNLLNENPDRYVAAVVTKGTEPNSLAVNYDIYEANPWHWFIQVDNAGTNDKQWIPRLGMINTNLFGYDDILTAIFQAPWDSEIDDEYSIFGSYDFPLFSQKLRLKAYGGYSQYDVNPDSSTFNFLGNGYFGGGILRYNLFQSNQWFFDLIGSVEHVKSKVSPTGLPSLKTDLHFTTVGWGADLHRSTDLADSYITYNTIYSLDEGSNGSEFALARTGSDDDFQIATLSSGHSQYFDANEIGRVSLSFKFIEADNRLPAAKMTTFGGLYSVRGYEEDEIVADGGVLFSTQYEHDLVKAQEVRDRANKPKTEQQQEQKEQFFKKFAPLVFYDFGRAHIEDNLSTENNHTTLQSAGTGFLFEIGNNFSGGFYYGWPLSNTSDTDIGDGRCNASFLLRW